MKRKRMRRKLLWFDKKVALYNSYFHLFPDKFCFKWHGPFVFTIILPRGGIEICNKKNVKTFKVNGYRFRIFYESHDMNKVQDPD